MVTQYTIRNVPEDLDKALRKRARRSGKSINQTLLDLLSTQVLPQGEASSIEGFDWLFGADSLDESFDEAIDEQSQIDPQIWC